MNAVRVRAMREEDLAQVLLLDCMSLNLPWPESAYRHELSSPASRPWVAETVLEAPLTYHTDAPIEVNHLEKPAGERAVLGMLILWRVLDEAHVATVAVHPQMRRRGIGRLILHTALIDAAHEGAEIAFLEVRTGNTGAQKLYEETGFKVVGRRPHYYKDNGEDALLMTLEDLATRAAQLTGTAAANPKAEDGK